MNRWGTTGRWLAAVVLLAAVIGAGSRDWSGSPTPEPEPAVAMTGASEGATASPAKVAIRLPALVAGTPQSLALTRPMLERALRSGALEVSLPGGARYLVALEREQVEPGGQWTVIGRVQTRLGPQAMVLTFGPDAVFGILPRPDGSQLQVATTRGVTTVAPAGGLLPPGKAGMLGADPDYVMPPVDPGTVAHSAGVVRAESAAAASDEASSGIDVVVLGLYSDDLVELRGSVSAAETEMSNLFATANQSHIDSGTRVRLQLAGLRQIAVDPSLSNHAALDAITYDQVAGVDLTQLRDSLAADLVALVRPYLDTHGTCGVAWLNGGGQSRQYISEAYGFSVTNVAPCGPHVLAHELGHNLGSAHDRETQTTYGVLDYGAYPFSFGYRQNGPPAFATVMAYAVGQPWVGYFSGPKSVQCGVSCGVAEEADNVRSQDLMAPLVAAFRGPPGTLSIVDTEIYETDPDGRPSELVFTVRLSGVAPAGGVRFDAVVSGGTAQPNVDFTASTMTGLTIPEGRRETEVRITILGDELQEADETVLLRLINVAGATVDDAEAVGRILNDDPRLTVTGRIRFPIDAEPPSSEFNVWVRGIDGDSMWNVVKVAPPDFAYRIPVVKRANFAMYADSPPPFVNMPFYIDDMRTSRVRNLVLQKGVRVSGEVRLPDGQPALTQPLGLVFTASSEGDFQALPYQSLEPPDFRYSTLVVPGAWVYIQVTPPSPYQPYHAIHTQVDDDLVQNLELSTLPTLAMWAPPDSPEGPAGTHGFGEVVVELASPAPAGGVWLRYSTADGTATAGSDYVATSGAIEFAEGEIRKSISMEWIGDDRVEGDEHLYVVISDISGANPASTRFTFIIKEEDRYMSTPLPPNTGP